MGDITFAGLSSGLDSTSIIKALVDFKRQPIVSLNSQADDYQSRLDMVNQIAVKLSTLRTAAGALSLSTTFAAYSVSSSNTAVVTAAATSNASEGNHTVSVGQLALAQTTKATFGSGAKITDQNAALGFVGSIDLTPTGGAATGPKQSIVVSATDTLDSIRSSINGTSAKAYATVKIGAVPIDGTTSTVDGTTYTFAAADPGGDVNWVDTSSGVASTVASNFAAKIASLGTNVTAIADPTNTDTVMISANAAGAAGNLLALTKVDTAGALVLSGSTLSGGGTGGLAASIVNQGTSSLPDYTLLLTARNTGSAGAVSATFVGTGTMTFSDTQSARDASLTVDGISVTRSSNVVSDVITGVTFTLVKDTVVSGPVTVAVAKDVSSVTTKISSFVSAFNDLRSYIAKNQTYDVETMTGGPLMGESSANLVSQGLSTIFGSAVSGISSGLETMSKIGITTQKDGTLLMNSSKVEAALSSNFQGVVDLFAWNLSTNTKGIGYQVQQKIDRWMSPIDGFVATRKTTISDSIVRLRHMAEEKESAITLYEQQLKEKYARLEQLISSLKNQSSSLDSLYQA